MAKITVFSQVYHTPEKYLREAIDSVLKQTFTDFVFKIYDNGCTDGTEKILEEYARKDSRIQLYRYKENNWNTGNYNQVPIPVSVTNPNEEAEYVCVIDSDDWYEPYFLEQTYSLAKTHNADLVTGDFEWMKEEDLSVIRTTKFTDKRVYKGKQEVADGWVKNYPMLRAWWNKLIRANLWKKHGVNYDNQSLNPVPPDVGSSLDNYLMQSIAGDCEVIAGVGKVTHHYRVRKASEINNLTPANKIMVKHIALYNHAIEILTKLGGVNEQRVESFRSVFRGGVASDDLAALISAVNNSPIPVIESLEKILNDSTVWEIFGGFEKYEQEFNRIVDLAWNLITIHGKKPKVANSFVTKLSKAWVETQRFAAFDRKSIQSFLDALFDKRNTNNAGRHKLLDALRLYKAPLQDCITLLDGDTLSDKKLISYIVERNPVLLLERLLQIALSPDKEAVLNAVFGVIGRNEHIRELPNDFILGFPLETSMIYHEQHGNAADSLEKRLNGALKKNDAESAEKILLALLRVAMVRNDWEMFAGIRVRRLELFVLTEQRGKAAEEYEMLKELYTEEQLQEVCRITDYHSMGTNEENPNKAAKGNKSVMPDTIDAKASTVAETKTPTKDETVGEAIIEKHETDDPTRKITMNIRRIMDGILGVTTDAAEVESNTADTTAVSSEGIVVSQDEEEVSQVSEDDDKRHIDSTDEVVMNPANLENDLEYGKQENNNAQKSTKQTSHSDLDANFWRGKKVLITGHTGFKGTWLCKILETLGAEVTGYALEPVTAPNLYTICKPTVNSIIADIRDFDALYAAFEKTKPEIVFHMAAQPLVLESYKNPRYTYDVNIMGTVNLLECARLLGGVKSFINVTTDKVYQNNERNTGYTEEERLNGNDPYANSKSCSELVTSAYYGSFLKSADVPVSTVRSGNVIGGGDFAENRILPDCARALSKNKPVEIRNPNSVRPYQHVLDTIFAYLLIAEKQYNDPSYAGAYNIGPDENDCAINGELAELFCKSWGGGASWKSVSIENPPESGLLRLDCSKAKDVLNWQPCWDISRSVKETALWYKLYYETDESVANALMKRQIDMFLEGKI